MNRSHASAICSARRIASSGIAWPNDTVAVLMWPPQSGQSGARPPARSNRLRTQSSS